MCGDLGLDLKVGGGTPRGEVGHEGTGGLSAGDFELARADSREHFALVLADRADSELCITNSHLDVTRNVVVDDDAGGALRSRNLNLFLKGGRATAYKNDLARNINSRVVGRSSRAGNGYKFVFSLIDSFTEEVGNEFLFLGNAVGCLYVIDDALAVKHIGRLRSVDRCNRKRTLVGRGRADCSVVGVGCKTEVTVLLGAIGGGEAVGSRNNHADSELADAVVNSRDLFLIALT